MQILAADSRANYVITLAGDAPPPQRNAALELATHLRAMSGAAFRIVPPSRTGGYPVIAVGPGAARAAGLPIGALRGLGDEGLLVRTFGRNLILSGGAGAPRGTLYAVYTFLEEILGCRWWTSDAEFIPNQPTLTIPRLAIRKIPIFEYREILYRHLWETRWSARNRTNGLWEAPPYGILPQWGGHIKYEGFVHTLVGRLVPSASFSLNPEWFAEVDDKRTPDQLCLSNPAVLAHVIAAVRASLRKNPSAAIVSVSQNDNHVYCRCAACRAVDEREGSPAGSLLHFVNAIAAAIEKEFPRVSVDTLAYLFSRKPPRHVRPRRNVIVRLCSFECDFLHPLDHANNRAFLRDLHGWARICKRLYIWDYVTNYAHFILPHPNWYVLADNIRIFRKYRIRGVFEQANNSSVGGELAEMRAWVLSKLLWNPDRDIDDLIDEFLHGYYSAGGAYIERYMRMMHAKALAIERYPGSVNIRNCLKKRGYPQCRKGCYLDLNSQPDAPFLTPAIILKGLAFFRQAVVAVKGDRVLEFRVQQAAMPLWYVTLLRWKHIRTHARRRNLPWRLPESRLQACRVFTNLARRLGITHLGEGWSHRDLPWLEKVCRGKATPYEIPS